MAGFFSSAVFRHIAPGVAAFVNERQGIFRLLISPILSDQDREAIRKAVEDRREVLSRAAVKILEGAFVSQSALQQHTLECFSYLLAAGRLEVQFVLMNNGALFHPKVWLFDDEQDLVVVHGSSNATEAGLLFNFEVVSIERSWVGDESLRRAERFRELFERLWRGADPDAITIGLPAGLSLAHRAGARPPTIEDFWRAWHEDFGKGLAPPLPVGRRVPQGAAERRAPPLLIIPEDLQWIGGPFGHQEKAVLAWENAGGRGLLSMATGSGKTVSALICATRLQKSEPRLLLIVAAPFRPLVQQWKDEVIDFGIQPIALDSMTANERGASLDEAVRRLARGVSRVEVAVITHDYLVSDSLAAVLDGIPPTVTTMLIADEVHNLGRPQFVARPPRQFRFRLGLSATPILQYNQVGTEAIADFFGETVFDFSLADAIGVCLVPYNYYIHVAPLAQDELEAWESITERLRRAGFLGQDDGSDGRLSPQVLALLVKRRAVLETAASKVGVLRRLLEKEGTDRIRHTLVYCSDKRPEQLVVVNQTLLQLGLYVRQITAEETVDRRRTAQILSDFARGDYQVITCKRVLDEGVDLPQVRHAYILASSTVRRQWIQRRGRILRRCEAIGKQIAFLHDFVVVPDDLGSTSGQTILRQELERARAFAELAANAGSPDGPFATIGDLSGRCD